MGNDQTINFWLDNWYTDYPLSLMFPHVYAKIKSSFMSLSEVWNEGHIKLNLTRGASLLMRQEKAQIIFILNALQFTTENDSAIWLWEANYFYTIKSLYNFLCFEGVITTLSKSVWSLKIPLKHKFFFWMALHNKILTSDNLRGKKKMVWGLFLCILYKSWVYWPSVFWLSNYTGFLV
jgi:zinc-binding in reverse transcriptase